MKDIYVDRPRKEKIMFSYKSSKILMGFVIVVFIFGCQIENNNPQTSTDPKLYLVSSDIGVGSNRIPFFILKGDGSRLTGTNQDLLIKYYKESEDLAYKASNTTWRPWPKKGGLYVTDMQFLSYGLWNVKISFGDPKQTVQSTIIVKANPDAPNLGEQAPVIKTKTVNDTNPINTLTSDPDPDPNLYAVSLDQALRQSIPVVITLSTPGYCQTATCGPQTKVLSDLSDSNGENIAFIHVEIFENPLEMKITGDPSVGVESESVMEWGITTEPWTFLIDQHGIIKERYEGFVSKEELQEDINTLMDK